MSVKRGFKIAGEVVEVHVFDAGGIDVDGVVVCDGFCAGCESLRSFLKEHWADWLPVQKVLAFVSECIDK